MTALDRVRAFFRRTKAATLTFIPRWITQGAYTPTFRELASEGYRVNSAVFACTTALAFAFQEPPLMVLETDSDGNRVPRPDHPLSRLLARPNPSMSGSDLAMLVMVYIAIGGNCYLWKQRNALGQTIALWPFSDAHMKPLPGHTASEGWIRAYRYDPGSGDTQDIDPNDIIHFTWMPDPLQPWCGLGPIAALAREVDTDNQARRYIFALLKNDAMPRAVITLTEGDILDDEKYNRLKAKWMQKYGGENQGVPAFLEAGMKVERLSLSLHELALEALLAVPEARICAGFRTPAIVAGVNIGLARSTYSNFGEARLQWTEQTILPLCSRYAAALTAGFIDEYPGAFITHDFTNVRALEDQEMTRRQQLGADLDRGLITRGEWRQAFGLPVTEQDDVYKESLQFFWTPRTAQPREPVEPTEDEDQAPPEQAGGNGRVVVKAWALS